ncbi:MAG: DnaJ family domain-containing protein [Planctomycetota bacterium]|jgi:hypothetical protein
MTERKPAGESWGAFTERQIRQAQEAGEFSGLPGFGQPIPGIDEPLDENWWLKQKLRREKLSGDRGSVATRTGAGRNRSAGQ